jgi:hypothetical protein
MGLDIRLPIGLMFLTLGPVLVGFGWSQDIAMDQQVGAAMLAFGAMMTTLGWRGDRQTRGPKPGRPPG